MSKQDSLCLRCRSHIHLRYRSYNLQKESIVSILNVCKKGLYQQYFESSPHIFSCSEFDNIFPGVTIDAYPPKLMSSRPDFIVRARGKVEEQLCSSLEGAMEAAADLLKKELIKYRGDSHTKT